MPLRVLPLVVVNVRWGGRQVILGIVSSLVFHDYISSRADGVGLTSSHQASHQGRDAERAAVTLGSRRPKGRVWRQTLRLFYTQPISDLPYVPEENLMRSRSDRRDSAAIKKLLAEFNETLRKEGRPDFTLLERCPPGERKELLSLMNVAALCHRALAPEREAFQARKEKVAVKVAV